MYLSSKQMIQLITPFLLAMVLFFFQENIVASMHRFFPKVKSVRNNHFHKNVTEYLQINREMNKYSHILTKIDEKKSAVKWISRDVLYRKNILKNNRKQQGSTSAFLWRLEAVFPKYNMAIINSQFVHKGSTLNDAKVIQIKIDAVLLKTKKGLKWLHLFH